MYPNYPFKKSLSPSVITGLDVENGAPIVPEAEYERLMTWLCQCPKISSYRINSLKYDTQEAFKVLKRYFEEFPIEDPINIEIHDLLPNVLIIHNKNIRQNFKRYEKEIIIDTECASAILRGAHIYGPGVLGMTTETHIGDKVSIYADLNKKCKKGLQKLYTDEGKLFIGNGIAKMQRHHLFADKIIPRGIAVELTESISGCPPLNDESILPAGSALLQNLPSILCVMALNPKPGDSVLDMCASPGNKTTHIAELMKNEGILIALDKTPRKVEQLKYKCELFGSKADSFVADSTKIVADTDSSCSKKLVDGPPFLPELFDKILLDAPCSVLGKRPQLINRMSENEIKSYAPLQKKLFKTAVKLLKPQGILVYSTCTITLAENEGIVAWALKKFDLELFKPEISLGGPGWSGTNLSKDQLDCVQRFGPDQDVDSVGFFFACFRKK